MTTPAPLRPPRRSPGRHRVVAVGLLGLFAACTEREPAPDPAAATWLRRAVAAAAEGHAGRRLHRWRTLGDAGSVAFREAEPSAWRPGEAGFPGTDALAWDGSFEERVRARRTTEAREAFVELVRFTGAAGPDGEPTEEQRFHHERRSAFVEHFRELLVEDVERLVAHHRVRVVGEPPGSVAGRPTVRVDAEATAGGAGYALFLDRESGRLLRWVEFVARGDAWLAVAESAFLEVRALEPGEAIPLSTSAPGRRLALDEVPVFLGGADVSRPTLPERFAHVERWAFQLAGLDLLVDVWSDGLAKVLLLQGAHLDAELTVDEGSLRVLEQAFGRCIAFQATVKGYLVILVARGNRDQARTWFSTCL